MGLWIQESFVNQTEGHRYGDSDVYESFADTPGELFRYGQKEYGRCASKVYVDTPEGPKAVGWVFESKTQYEDSSDSYIREVWITVHSEPDTVTRTSHYVYI